MKIITLALQEAQKIAAGEVVERPANSIKELLENSLDAGATKITLSLFEAGKKQIIITDNGSGMAPEDAQICFKRHTTSKIKTIDQLETITTFGFRGEALASICSVAKVTLTTKPQNSDQGIELTLENGTIIHEKIVGCQTGTTIIIDDLFYNVPARKKFLKSSTTEWNHILNLFKAFALDNSSVHFILKHNESVVYNCPPVGTMKERVRQLFDPKIAENSITFAPTETNGITLSGTLTTQNYARYDRGGLFFFVNSRWVKNYQLANALTKGYLNVLPSGRYPAAIISLTLDPTSVDINVHPKKEEVQFLKPRTVESAITAAVKTTLEQHLSRQLKRTVAFAPQQQEQQEEFRHPFIPMPPFENFQEIAPKVVPEEISLQEPVEQNQTEQIMPHQKTATEEAQKQQAVEQPGILIGQYRNTYLLLEKQDGLFLIDQHAAHERILYEQFSKRFNDVPIIELLFPHTVEINQHDMSLLEPHLHLFKEQGIVVEPISTDRLAIKATPVFFKNEPIDDIIQKMISWIKETNTINSEDFYKTITERLRAQMACKAAIKAGDRLSNEAMEQLLADLETINNRFTCPHGRPTSWFLSLNELERKFKRKL